MTLKHPDHRRLTTRSQARRGVGVAEVVVLILILGMVALLLALALPRQRERAREAACQRNLMQIGVALGLYHQSVGALPTVPVPGPLDAPVGPGPLAAMLETLVVTDFAGLDPSKPPSIAGPTEPPGERIIPGFLCPSDPGPAPNLGAFPAPVSYRATTGDTVEGRGGPFEPGRTVTLAEVEAGDGIAFTSAFAERLLGAGTAAPGPARYAAVDGPVAPAGCPEPAEPSAWRGDAGWSWAEASWRSTLLTHAVTPGAVPSCVALDGRTANIGASSGHRDRAVFVLMLDGGVRRYGPTVEPSIWRRLATLRDPDVPAEPSNLPRPSAEDAGPP